MTKFNPLVHVKRLKDAGVPELQANIPAEGLAGLAEALENDLAKKEDLDHLEQRFDSKIDNLEQRLDSRIVHLELKISTVETVLSTKIGSVDTKLNWLISLIGTIGILLTLLNFFHLHS